MRHQQTLWVTNTNGEDYEDRFDGEDFYFPAPRNGVSEPVEIPVEGACLMFGYGEDNKTSTLMRAGKAATANDLKSGLVWLANFAFNNAKPTAHELAPVVQNPEAAVGDSAPSGVEQPSAKPTPTVASSTQKRVAA
jgi:hypothetical protein